MSDFDDMDWIILGVRGGQPPATLTNVFTINIPTRFNLNTMCSRYFRYNKLPGFINYNLDV